MRTLAISFLSGAPALVYQVIWTRELALLAGSQIEAIAVVLAVYFGGMALGARQLGRVVDRYGGPLRFYGIVEAAAGLGAITSTLCLMMLAAWGPAHLPELVLLVLASAVLLPVTFLLGGTLPALLRSATSDAEDVSRRAGWLVGANTGGAVVGVAVAALAAPSVGLRPTLFAAGIAALLLGLLAFWLGGPLGVSRRAERADPHGVPFPILAGAALAGVATLAYEVLAARSATLRLGSSLFAWAAVLALFLAALALGNASFATRARRAADPRAALGSIQFVAALCLTVGIRLLVSSPSTPAVGLTPGALADVALAVFPPAFLMGAAFPFFVRLGVGASKALGASFGALSAANTAGGIVGSLLAPFVLLPLLGLAEGIVFCAALNALLGAAFLLRSGLGRIVPGVSSVGALVLIGGSAWAALVPEHPAGSGQVLFVHHGRQASAAVVRTAGRRDLIVDGDPEASTFGHARATEELLAALPMVLHPNPRSFLEVGFGSGITVATAARFPLERIDCVELSDSVLRAARYFAPDNAAFDPRGDPRARIFRGDGRAFLARHPGAYDVVVANTVHPWSVGATGLYSLEYFGRVARALRPGGLAVQWLPLQRLGARDLTLILRTFFAVFPEGGVWWGANNLIAVGSVSPLSGVAAAPAAAWAAMARAGIDDAAALGARRLARPEAVRRALGDGPTLRDGRPVLEARASWGRARPTQDNELTVVEALARAEAVNAPGASAILWWVQSRGARDRGELEQADRLEARAEAAGLALARRDRAERWVRAGFAQLRDAQWQAAEVSLRRALALDAVQRDARFGLAALARSQKRWASAAEELERLVAEHPLDGEAWNELGTVRHRRGDSDGARRAFVRALEVDPFFPEALANAGLLAAGRGDRSAAESLLGRLHAISPLGSHGKAEALRAALDGDL